MIGSLYRFLLEVPPDNQFNTSFSLCYLIIPATGGWWLELSHTTGRFGRPCSTTHTSHYTPTHTTKDGGTGLLLSPSGPFWLTSRLPIVPLFHFPPLTHGPPIWGLPVEASTTYGNSKHGYVVISCQRYNQVIQIPTLGNNEYIMTRMIMNIQVSVYSKLLEVPPPSCHSW